MMAHLVSTEVGARRIYSASRMSVLGALWAVAMRWFKAL
jgi:hypothetical protein